MVRSSVLLLAAVLLVATPASASMTWGIFDILGTIGLVDSDLDGTIGFGGGVTVAQMDQLSLDARVQYWSSGFDTGFQDSDYDFSVLAILPGATWHFPLENSPNITPFARGGVGFYRASVDTPEFNTGFGVVGGGSSSSTEFGLFLGGGAEFDLNEEIAIRGIVEIHLSDADYNLFGGELVYSLP